MLDEPEQPSGSCKPMGQMTTWLRRGDWICRCHVACFTQHVYMHMTLAQAVKKRAPCGVSSALNSVHETRMVYVNEGSHCGKIVTADGRL